MSAIFCSSASRLVADGLCDWVTAGDGAPMARSDKTVPGRGQPARKYIKQIQITARFISTMILIQVGPDLFTARPALPQRCTDDGSGRHLIHTWLYPGANKGEIKAET